MHRGAQGANQALYLLMPLQHDINPALPSAILPCFCKEFQPPHWMSRMILLYQRSSLPPHFAQKQVHLQLSCNASFQVVSLSQLHSGPTHFNPIYNASPAQKRRLCCQSVHPGGGSGEQILLSFSEKDVDHRPLGARPGTAAADMATRAASKVILLTFSPPLSHTRLEMLLVGLLFFSLCYWCRQLYQL